MNNIFIDFSPALHGQFLEFVVNTYIFRTPNNIENLFFNCGGAHAINLDQVYLQNRVVESGHLSSLGDCNYPSNISKIIYIKYNPKYSVIATTNRILRCHQYTNHENLDPEFIKKWHEDAIFAAFKSDSPATLRNALYTKIIENHLFVEEDIKEQHTDFAKYYFDYGAFFSFPEFLKSLNEVANYLGLFVFYDSSLYQLWEEFIRRNQGFNYYTRGNYLLEKIYANEPEIIDDNEFIRAWINVNLSTAARLFEGPLFDSDAYASTTQEIYKMILKNILDLDKL